MTNKTWIFNRVLQGMLASLFVLQPAFGQSPIIPGFVTKIPVQVQLLLQGPKPPATVSASMPSQEGISLPSLWWVDEQFGEKMVLDWFAYANSNPQKQQVNIFIRSNLWARFSYLERYAFINHFGAIARIYGYQTILIDAKGYPLASYVCDFTSTPTDLLTNTKDSRNQPIKTYEIPKNPQNPCEIWVNSAFPRNVL